MPDGKKSSKDWFDILTSPLQVFGYIFVIIPAMYIQSWRNNRLVKKQTKEYFRKKREAEERK